MPALEYVCGPFVPCVLVPSPQLITVLTMSFSGSVQLPLAVTLRGTGPLAGATVSAQVGGTFGLLTVTVWDADPVSPPESVAFNVTVNEPALVKVCAPLVPLVLVPLVLVPSPQVITSLTMSFSGSVQLPVAVTASGAGPLFGATWSVHEGGTFGLPTVTVWDAEPVFPAESVAVNVTVNEPGLMKVWVPLVPTVLVPSPQVITSLMMSFSGSVQLPVAVTASGAGPLLGATWSVHEGGAFGGVTTIC